MARSGTVRTNAGGTALAGGSDMQPTDASRSPATPPLVHSNSSSGRSSPRLESGAPSKVTKSTAWRAASHIGSVVDDWPMYSSQAGDYILGPIVGFGASSVVYQASFIPLNGRACAVKVIDLEAFGRDLAELRRETQLMSLSKHPNVLRVRGCWVEGTKLHIATRLMNAGSMLDIMRFSYQDGFDESVIATVLKQALEGLNYLHINGWLHRDLKAANVLVDDDGTVLLGDFGVGVYLTETGKSTALLANGSTKISSKAEDESTKADASDQAARKSFVGTPCWMAPEVVERKGYGAKADIWSYGITALELSSGRAPHSRLPPVKVLMHTLQDDPPTLDRKGGAYQYSKLFDDFVRQCLQKDPAKRPSAEKLLSHGFFRQAKSKKHLVSTILSGLPPLAERQERQRAMSIASLQNQTSWDFGSMGPNSAVGSRINTPGFEAKDPFSNFNGVFTSPKGSMRSTKLISFDGEHALVDDVDASLASYGGRRNSWRESIGSAAARKSRPTSVDFSASGAPPPGSWGRRSHSRRLSVSFHVDAAETLDEEQETNAEEDEDGSGARRIAMHDQSLNSTGDTTADQSQQTVSNDVGQLKESDREEKDVSSVTSTPASSKQATSDGSPVAQVEEKLAEVHLSSSINKHGKAVDRLGKLFKRH